MEKEGVPNYKAGLRRAVGFYMFLFPLAGLTAHCLILITRAEISEASTPNPAEIRSQESTPARVLLQGSPPLFRLKMAEAQKDPHELIPYQRLSVQIHFLIGIVHHHLRGPARFQERRDDVSPNHNEYNL